MIDLQDLQDPHVWVPFALMFMFIGFVIKTFISKWRRARERAKRDKIKLGY